MAKTDYRNLGAAVSEYVRAVEVDSIDDRIAGWGDCRSEMYRGVARDGDKVARKHGFRDAAHLIDVVAERTSSRFVYFHMPRFN